MTHNDVAPLSNTYMHKHVFSRTKMMPHQQGMRA